MQRKMPLDDEQGMIKEDRLSMIDDAWPVFFCVQKSALHEKNGIHLD